VDFYGAGMKLGAHAGPGGVAGGPALQARTPMPWLEGQKRGAGVESVKLRLRTGPLSLGDCEAKASAPDGAAVTMEVVKQKLRLRTGPPCLLGLGQERRLRRGPPCPGGLAHRSAPPSMAPTSDRSTSLCCLRQTPRARRPSVASRSWLRSGKANPRDPGFRRAGLAPLLLTDKGKGSGVSPALREQQQNRNDGKHAPELSQEQSHAPGAPKDAAVRG